MPSDETSNNVAIRVEELRVRFGDREVLRGISLSIFAGEIFTIMGSSGGGKTTFLKSISGLITPTSGRIEVLGRSTVDDPEGVRRTMGLVFQNAALFDYMTVEENIAFGLQRHGGRTRAEISTIVDDVLTRVDLDLSVKRRLPSELSGGMKKRVGIARAIALQPAVLLYDEPITGLDPVTTYRVDSLIYTLRETLGVTSLVVSHDLNSALRTSDRIMFLHQGEAVFVGGPHDFLADPHPAIQELIRKSRATELAVTS